jgi:hypothetical protein
MRKDGQRVREELPASRGRGPLLQRDYWAVIDRPAIAPSEMGRFLARRFCDVAPSRWVRFWPTAGGDREELTVGDELDVHIAYAGTFAVRVVHRNANSITLCTLEKHPEAGKITFGAYRDARGDMVFHIRSRARASSYLRYVGFLVAGEPMQLSAWTDYIDRLAELVGAGVRGPVSEETRRVPEDESLDGLEAQPTFLAEGD